MNIRMRKVKSIAAFANQYQDLLPSDYDPNDNLLKHRFISKLLIEVQTLLAVHLYDEKGSFHEIYKEYTKVHKLILNHSGKCSRTQVNTVEDNSEEEEKESEDQAGVNLIDGDKAHTLLILRILAAGLSWPGGLIIVFQL